MDLSSTNACACSCAPAVFSISERIAATHASRNLTTGSIPARQLSWKPEIQDLRAGYMPVGRNSETASSYTPECDSGILASILAWPINLPYPPRRRPALGSAFADVSTVTEIEAALAKLPRPQQCEVAVGLYHLMMFMAPEEIRRQKKSIKLVPRRQTLFR